MILSNLYRYLPFIFIVVAFGPYIHLGLGIRLEHLVIYPLFVLMFLFSFKSKYVFIKDGLVLFAIWMFAVAFMGIRTLFGNESELISALSDFESIMQPFVILLLFTLIVINFSKGNAKERIIKASKILIFLLSLNTIWSIFNIFMDFTTINSYFWGSKESVASRAMTNGRFSGVFNQPMEAGVMYSIGLFCWVYLSERLEKIKLRYIISLFLMIIGGLLTVSKVFLFGGLGLFFLGVIFNKNIWKLMFSLSFWSLAIGAPTFYFFTKTWGGLDYLLRFFGSNQGIIRLLTSGRFGENSQQSSLFESVWKQNPLFGSGFGVHPIYDSGFFYFFGNGGLLALVFYVIILIIFVLMAIKFLILGKLNSESKFFSLIVILIIGSSVGVPVLTLNRVSIVLWVFVGLLIQYSHFFKVGGAEPEIVTENVKTKKRRKFKRYKIV